MNEWVWHKIRHSKRENERTEDNVNKFTEL